MHSICTFIFVVLVGFIGSSQNKKHDYFRFIDSANVYIDGDYYKKSQFFLDSIAPPIEESIKGRVAEYYAIKALIHDGDSEYAKQYQCYLNSLKYAEKEHDYKLAGDASLELFIYSCYSKYTTADYQFLEKAKKYYALCGYDNGAIEISQSEAFAKHLEGSYKASNNLILEHFEDYKNLKEEPYYYMFATYMLISNYMYLGDLKEAYSYYNEFKSFKNNPDIVKYNYLSFKATIDSYFAEFYFEKKQIDSTYYYLDEMAALRNYMISDVVKSYFELNVNINKLSGNIEVSKKYIDSLLVFEERMLDGIVDASFDINNSLLKAETEIKKESKKKALNGFLLVVLFCVFACTSVFYFIYYRKHKSKWIDLKDQESNFSYLKENNEKLTVKLKGLETYIGNVKKGMKEISSIDVSPAQREKIKQLYNDLHSDASVLLDKTESHVELVNDLNIEFFNRIQTLHPQLNDSDIVICYYLFVGFKNKEIALFLNTSLRAIESKRYRITNKINLNKNETTLIKYLTETFKEVKVNS